MRVRTDLPIPTMDFVQSKISEFERDNDALERGLTELIERFPKNEDVAHSLVKVAAINSLYNTQMRGIFRVAKVIADSGIDSLLESGSDDAVKAIAKVEYTEKSRFNYSFATKYCSWHRPEFYPIYDSRVDFCLRSYQAKDHFATLTEFDRFTQNDLWDYGKLRGIMKAFQRHYRLESLIFKSLDKFLYQLGSAYFLVANRVLQPSGMAPRSA